MSRPPHKMKIGLLSLGCPKNLVDREVMLGIAQQAGALIVNDPQGRWILLEGRSGVVHSEHGWIMEWPRDGGPVIGLYMDPDSFAAWVARTLERGLQAASAAVELEPESAANYEIRGRLRAEYGDRDGARRDFRAAAALEPARAEELLRLVPAGASKERQ